MSDVDSYRENLEHARHRCEITSRQFIAYRDKGLIVRGTTKRGFDGVLVVGTQADDVYTAYVTAKSDLDHWAELLKAELKKAAMSDRRLPREPGEDD